MTSRKIPKIYSFAVLLVVSKRVPMRIEKEEREKILLLFFACPAGAGDGKSGIFSLVQERKNIKGKIETRDDEPEQAIIPCYILK